MHGMPEEVHAGSDNGRSAEDVEAKVRLAELHQHRGLTELGQGWLVRSLYRDDRLSQPITRPRPIRRRATSNSRSAPSIAAVTSPVRKSYPQSHQIERSEDSLSHSSHRTIMHQYSAAPWERPDRPPSTTGAPRCWCRATARARSRDLDAAAIEIHSIQENGSIRTGYTRLGSRRIRIQPTVLR
jgi:hypothetical protein